MGIKICTISPQGNGLRNGGITRFSGALKRKGIDNFFWELQPGSWNGDFVDWEGEPFKLENHEDEEALKAQLEKYDVIVNSWPTLTANEHNSYRLWRVLKSLERPTKVTVIHNTILAAVRKENLSPLVWSDSDYILVQVSDNSTLVQELLQRMPWLKGKIKQFKQALDIEEFAASIEPSNLLLSNKSNLALWVGRWENCRNAARWSKVLKDAKEEGFKSEFVHCAMGLDSDVKTYWSFFATDKENHIRLNSYSVKKDAEFLRADGGLDVDHVVEMVKENKDHDLEPNDFVIFGKYDYDAGMRLLETAKFGISTFGAWKDDLVDDYRSLAKLEYASLEIMLLSLPVFDYRHLETMENTELFDADWVFKSKHNATPEENVKLLENMQRIGNDASLYIPAREANIDYVKRNHSVESFIELLENCHKQGKTEKLSEAEVMKRLYSAETTLTDDMWVSLGHSAKGVVHVIEWGKSNDKKPPKMNIVPKARTTELF